MRLHHGFFTEHIRQFLALSIAVQCLSAMVFLYSYQSLQRTARDNVLQFTENYVEGISEQLSRNNAYMEQSIVLSDNYRTMFHQQNDMDMIDKLAELQVTYRLLKEISMNEYNFFVYEKEEEKYVELTSVGLPFSSYRKIRPDIIEEIGSEPKNGEWYLMDTEGGRVVISIWTYGNFVLGGWICEEDLLADIKSLDWGYNGGVALIYKESDQKRSCTGFGTYTVYYEIEGCSANFIMQAEIDINRGMARIMIIQIIQFFLALQVMIILILLIWQIRRNFIVPMKNLTDILEKYQSVMPGNLKGTIEVVEDAYTILDKLGEKMETLTVELYESELEKKQLQLNFRNLQIRPHFFVNCLAMISGMAQVNAVDKIQKITVCLSKYFRYILHDCMDMVPLQQEIEHMENLVFINAEWDSNMISFTCQIEDCVRYQQIPVLSISTFLENSIKHGEGTDGILNIHLEARKENGKEEYLFLQITDNGKGFPEMMVEQLNSGSFLEEKEGKHIGINNVLQRFKLIYDNRATVRFSQTEGGGACVTIRIPIEKEQK